MTEHRGGKRRHHMPPALTAQQLDAVAPMREQGSSYQHIADILKVGRTTLYRALNGLGAYPRRSA